MLIPQFKHNCDKCVLIGQIKDYLDIYKCAWDKYITALARFSDNELDYNSGSFDLNKFKKEYNLRTLSDDQVILYYISAKMPLVFINMVQKRGEKEC